MDKRRKLALGLAVTGALALAGSAVAADGGRRINTSLNGYEEVPASISTTGTGRVQTTVNPSNNTIAYKLTYSALEGNVTQAHIHFGQLHTAGGISVFLCTNLGNGPTGAGTPACPPGPATVEGTLDAADVVGPAAQGIQAQEMAEVIKAIRAGATYANVHSSLYPSGEIRGQLGGSGDDRDDDD